MGIGDELMASGEARRLHKKAKTPVMIVGIDGRPRWSEVWEGVSYIAKRPGGKHVARMINCGGHRPYIAGKTANNWTWKAYKPIPAEIVFTAAERAFAEPYRGMVMIEPNVKNIGHDNKAWLANRWRELALRSPLETVQCTPSVTGQELPGAHVVVTPTFRHAAAVLSVCKAFIGTEGGLMHAAAAVGTPSVILWSEFISPEITGYETMTNLRHAGKPCGNRMRCAGCRKSMEAITVEEVVAALEKLL